MPSAATSDGSQSEWSAPGMLSDEALRRDRHVDAERVDRDVERPRVGARRDTVRCSSAAFAMPYAIRPGK